MSTKSTRHHVTVISHNKKLGPISVTRSQTTKTCPKSCPLLDGGGCYDQSGNGAIHRRRVDSNEYATLSFPAFLGVIKDKVSRIYRHNEGGDLWSKGNNTETICPTSLQQFVDANVSARKTPILYTHKSVVGTRATKKIRQANGKVLLQAKAPFALNVSVESMHAVDVLLDNGHDAVTIIPHDEQRRVTRTPKGNRIVTCPATYSKVQCVNCGNGSPLCTRKGRGYAVGFPAHGASKKRVTASLLKVLQ